MAVFVVGFLLLFAMAGYSDAVYCVCNTGLSDSVLQTNIDYACGAGADCAQIQQNGPCFNPNTVRDHCNYAVNSYFQKKGQAAGSCDFKGTATVTQTAPTASSGCAYLSSPSTGGTPTTGTPTPGGPPTTGTTTPGGPPTIGTPTTGATPTTGGTPTTAGTPNAGGTPNMGSGTIPGSNTNPGFSFGPTASGFPSTDNSAGLKLTSQNVPFTISVILIAGLIWARI